MTARTRVARRMSAWTTAHISLINSGRASARRSVGSTSPAKQSISPMPTLARTSASHCDLARVSCREAVAGSLEQARPELPLNREDAIWRISIAEKNHEVIEAFFQTVFNRGESNAADRYIGSTFVDHSPWPGHPPTLAGFKAGGSSSIGVSWTKLGSHDNSAYQRSGPGAAPDLTTEIGVGRRRFRFFRFVCAGARSGSKNLGSIYFPGNPFAPRDRLRTISAGFRFTRIFFFATKESSNNNLNICGTCLMMMWWT